MGNPFTRIKHCDELRTQGTLMLGHRLVVSLHKKIYDRLQIIGLNLTSMGKYIWISQELLIQLKQSKSKQNNWHILWDILYLERIETTLIAKFIGPAWGPSVADRTQVGPILAPWTLLSGYLYVVWQHQVLSIARARGRITGQYIRKCKKACDTHRVYSVEILFQAIHSVCRRMVDREDHGFGVRGLHVKWRGHR